MAARGAEHPDRYLGCVRAELDPHARTQLLSLGRHGWPDALGAAKQVFGRQVFTTQSPVGSAAAFLGTPEPGHFWGSAGSAYVSARCPLTQSPRNPPYSAGQQLRAHEQRVLQCRPGPSPSHTPMPCTATLRSPRQGHRSFFFFDLCLLAFQGC